MKVNIVLSGGGARGLAHLGILKALFEQGIKINKISGASMGAAVGAFIAHGFTPDEILKIIIDTKLLYQIRPSFDGGIFRINKWEKILLKYMPENSFSSLSIPLIVNATNINECKTEYFSKGELIAPILASSTLPGFFTPAVISNQQYVDGGVLDNLPVQPFIGESKKIIASHVNPLLYEEKLDSSAKIFERSVLLSIREKTKSSISKSDFCFEPPELVKYSLFDFDHVKEIFDVGYRFAQSRGKELEKALTK